MPNYFLISLISNVFQIINMLIIIRVLLSWFNVSSYNQYIRFLYTITEPILAPFRNLLSSFNMGIDISEGMLSRAETRLSKQNSENYSLSIGSAFVLKMEDAHPPV